jgi:hypothetical protein
MINIQAIKANRNLSRRLQQGLVDFWPLSESSGTRAGIINGNNMTNSGAVSGGAGTCGSLASAFSGTAQYLYASSASWNQVGTENFTFMAWAYFTAFNYNPIIGKWGIDVNKREYSLFYDNGTNRMAFGISTDGTAGGFKQATATNFGAISLSTWYCFFGWNDIGNGYNAIQVNNTTPNTISNPGGAVFTSTTDFRFGSFGAISGDYLHAGRIERIGFWRRLLSTEERNFLYNSGCARIWPFYLN